MLIRQAENHDERSRYRCNLSIPHRKGDLRVNRKKTDQISGRRFIKIFKKNLIKRDKQVITLVNDIKEGTHDRFSNYSNLNKLFKQI